MRTKIIFVVFILGFGIVYGALMERYNLFPRPILVKAIRMLSSMEGPEEVGKPYIIETTFANLEVTNWPIELSADLGAIHAVDDRVVGTDRLGNFFLFSRSGDSKPQIRSLDIRIATAYDDFVEHAQNQDIDVQLNWFRVHEFIIDTEEDNIIVSHHFWNKQARCSTVRVSMADLDADDLEGTSIAENDWTVLFEASPCIALQSIGNPFEGLQASGRFARRDDNELLVAIGDHGLDGWGGTTEDSQDDVSSYGKVWSIDLSTGHVRIVSKGHRNPAGLLLDDNDRLWLTEHGPRGGDELNLVIDGGNFGWPQVTYGTQYEHYGEDYYAWPRSSAEEQGRHTGFDGATYVWVDGIGISNLIQVQNFLPAWNGDLLIASLGGRALTRLRYEDDSVLFAQRIRIGDRIRDIDQLDNGTIVLWSDDGQLIEIRPVALQQDVPEFMSSLEPNLRERVKSTITLCKQCHGFSAGTDVDIAPTLWGVVGRDIADSEYQMYSESLRQAAGAWTRESLDTFLVDPLSFAPGTSMVYGGVSDAEVRQEVIRYLETLN